MPQTKRKFYIFTYSFDGLGFALRMKEEGESVVMAVMNHKEATGKERRFTDAKEQQKAFEEEEKRLRVGDNMIEKTNAKDALRMILDANTDDIYIIFDFNYGFDIADSLRKRGYKVFGASKLGYQLENDRKFGMEFMKKLYKISPPEEFEFGKNGVDAALAEIETQEEKSFVVKPDEILQTFMPRAKNIDDSREELVTFMEGNKDELNKTPFILQEKIFGYEIASEVIFANGVPVIANADLESKRKFGAEMGPFTGCSGDMVFHIDMDSPLVKLANEPFFKFAKKMKYTGSHDLNIIFKDKKRFFGLEFCGTRLGYNAIYSYLSMIKIRVGNFFADLMDGNITENPEGGNFAASIRIFNANDTHLENIGYRVKDVKNTWIADAWKDGEQLKTAGYDETLAYVTATGPTPEEAFNNVYAEAVDAVIIPNQYYRKDLDKIEYPNPVYRYNRLKEMNLF